MTLRNIKLVWRRLPGLELKGSIPTVLRIADAPIIVNPSRAILYASSGEDFAEAARREALKTRDGLQPIFP